MQRPGLYQAELDSRRGGAAASDCANSAQQRRQTAADAQVQGPLQLGPPHNAPDAVSLLQCIWHHQLATAGRVHQAS